MTAVLAAFPAQAELKESDIVSSLALGVGIASGWSPDDIAQKIPTFQGVSVFEDRRLRSQAVTAAMARGQEFTSGGYPWISLNLANIPVSEYSLRDKEFRICLPWYSGRMPDDTPTDGIQVRLSIGKAQAASHASNNCPSWNLLGLSFHGAPYRLSMPDDILAEEFYNTVQGSGGKLSALVKCYFNQLENVIPGASLVCNLESLSVSLGGSGYDASKVLYEERWNYDTSKYVQDLLFGKELVPEPEVSPDLQGGGSVSESTDVEDSLTASEEKASREPSDPEETISSLNQVLGSYILTGENGSGSNYTGVVHISATSDNQASFVWRLGSVEYQATGRLVNGYLALNWIGEAIPNYLPRAYRRRLSGTLVGDWSVGSGREVLAPEGGAVEAAPTSSAVDEGGAAGHVENPVWQNSLGAGVWVGKVEQSSSTRSYTVRLTLTSETINVSYPELGCGGLLKFNSAISADQWLFSEKINIGKDRCVDGGDVVLSVREQSSISYRWYRPSEEIAEAWATLNKVGSP